MFTKEQNEVIVKYANERYEEGYRNGYTSGIVLGTITTLLIIVTMEIIRKV